MDALLDNIRSAFNVGSIFRSAQGAGIGHLYLCGMTATPANPKVAKTALAAEQAVAWSWHANAVDVAAQLRDAGRPLWVLETDIRAVPIADAGPIPSGMVLIVGHEVAGVDPALLRMAERIVRIPMKGSKRSLNVAVAFGIAAVVVGLISPGRPEETENVPLRADNR
jgi:tRNA G18 (ribose-2'-O)-methylase SpoU